MITEYSDDVTVDDVDIAAVDYAVDIADGVTSVNVFNVVNAIQWHIQGVVYKIPQAISLCFIVVRRAYSNDADLLIDDDLLIMQMMYNEVNVVDYCTDDAADAVVAAADADATTVDIVDTTCVDTIDNFALSAT